MESLDFSEAGFPILGASVASLPTPFGRRSVRSGRVGSERTEKIYQEKMGKEQKAAKGPAGGASGRQTSKDPKREGAKQQLSPRRGVTFAKN